MPIASLNVLHRALDESFPADVRHRITTLTLARTMANGCFRFAPPFLAIIARGVHTSLAGIGVALAVSELSGLASPLTAELVERLHRRRAMSLGLLGVGAGAMLAAGSVHPAMFAVALVILAQSKVMFDLGLGAWMSDRVPFERRSRVMGLTETSWALGLLLGVSLMGLVTALTNWRLGFGAGAVAVVTMAAIVSRGIEPDSGVHTSATRVGSLRGPDRRHWVMLAGTFCLMAASQSLFVTFGSWLGDTFSFTPAGISAVVFGLGAGELVASLTSARRTDAWGKERSAATGAAAMVVASLGLAAAHEHLAIGLLFLALAIAGFEFAIVSAIPLGTELVTGSPARGMALMLGAGTLGRALASIPATRLYDRHGIGWPAVMCAALASATVGTMWLAGTRRHDQPR